MKTLYEKLKPELKVSLKASSIKYHTGPRKVIAELHRYNHYTNLTIDTINDLILYSDACDLDWDKWDFKYGDKLFNND